jgi:RNA polymerase sigma-70 factor (ECF subfamily)
MVSWWLLGEGVVWAVGGRPRVVWDFTISDGKIVHIDMLAASDSLDRIDLTVLDG